MKIFLKSIEKTNPIVKLINVAAFSDFALGVRVLKDGVIVEDEIQLFAPDGTEITPMETTYGDFVAFQLTAGDGPHQDVYTVKAGNFEYQIVIDVEIKSTAEIGGAGGGSYTLPIASGTTLGGVKIGDNLAIDENGVLSAAGVGGDFIPTEAEDETNAFEWTIGKTERWDNNASSRQTLNGMDNVYFANEGDEYPSNASRVYSQEIFVAQQNPETGAIIKQSEMDADGVRATMVDESEVVHTGELKHDGVYVDDNGFKPMTLSGVTEDDLSVTFKVLGYEVQ